MRPGRARRAVASCGCSCRPHLIWVAGLVPPVAGRPRPSCCRAAPAGCRRRRTTALVAVQVPAALLLPERVEAAELAGAEAVVAEQRLRDRARVHADSRRGPLLGAAAPGAAAPSAARPWRPCARRGLRLRRWRAGAPRCCGGVRLELALGDAAERGSIAVRLGDHVGGDLHARADGLGGVPVRSRRCPPATAAVGGRGRSCWTAEVGAGRVESRSTFRRPCPACKRHGLRHRLAGPAGRHRRGPRPGVRTRAPGEPSAPGRAPSLETGVISVRDPPCAQAGGRSQTCTHNRHESARRSSARPRHGRSVST